MSSDVFCFVLVFFQIRISVLSLVVAVKQNGLLLLKYLTVRRLDLLLWCQMCTPQLNWKHSRFEKQVLISTISNLIPCLIHLCEWFRSQKCFFFIYSVGIAECSLLFLQLRLEKCRDGFHSCGFREATKAFDEMKPRMFLHLTTICFLWIYPFWSLPCCCLMKK